MPQIPSTYQPAFGHPCPCRGVLRPGRWLRLLALALLPALLLACYDSNPIQSAAVSPDGRYLAVRTAQDELGILSLEHDGSLRIYSRHAGRGFAWSPDSRVLAFVEQNPNAPSALWLLSVQEGRMVKPLVRDTAWKADPVWLSDQTLAFLSDFDSRDINIWGVDCKSGAVVKLLDRPRDISRLWGCAAGGSLIYQSAEAGTPELWWWQPALDKPLALSQDKDAQAGPNRLAALAPDGRHAAWVIPHAQRAELVWYDLERRQVLDRLETERPVADLTVLGDGRVAAGLGDRLLLWRPLAPWYRRETLERDWDGLPLRTLSPWSGNGLIAAANGNILVLADNPNHLEAGRIHSRRIEDLLNLAYGHARLGHFAPARRVLADLQKQVRKGSRDEYLLNFAWAELARLERRWRVADQWLDRTIKAAPAGGGPELETAWLERLALAAFDARNLPLAGWLLGKMPAEPQDTDLARFVGALRRDADSTPTLQRRWLEIGGRLRQGDTAAVAAAVRQALSDDHPATLTLQGLSLLLAGGLEPLADLDERGKRQQDALLAQPTFQLALLAASRLNHPAAPDPSELRSMLLMQWVRQGDFSSARLLVREALENDPQAASAYAEMLRQYLIAEEADRWLERAVTDVLLQPDIAQTLAGQLTAPTDRLALRLAQIKKALVAGNIQQAQTWVNEARLLLPGKAIAALAPAFSEGDEAAQTRQERIRSRFLILLFQAKLYERRERWPQALDAYQACLDLMRQEPDDWDTAGFEIDFLQGLIALAAPRDADLLGSYLRIQRGMGDPLLNPSRDPATIQTALNNLQTLRQVSASSHWLQPYLDFSQGLCHVQLEQPWRALFYFERACRLKPPPSLLRRILLEEAALRDGLGQHARAARLYGQLLGQNLPAPLRAAAILASLQAELACGQISSPTARLHDWLQQEDLPAGWEEWLRLQLGDSGSATQ